jgi:hypothetical protein
MFMEFDEDRFRNFLKSAIQMGNLVVEKDRWKAYQYDAQQATLIDAMPEIQLLTIHQFLTHPDMAKNPVIFDGMHASTACAILRQENGMRLFISPSGNYEEAFHH